MKAAYFAEHGGPEKIIYGDFADPVPQPGEAVVRVAACALNHVARTPVFGRSVRNAMSLSAGFGGTNVALVVSSDSGMPAKSGWDVRSDV